MMTRNAGRPLARPALTCARGSTNSTGPMVSCVLAYAATSTGSPQAAWRLIAEPAQWHRWAAHVRGASGLGKPEVEAGRRGFILLAPGLPVPTRITDKQAGQWRDWHVGPVDMRHSVEHQLLRAGCGGYLLTRSSPGDDPRGRLERPGPFVRISGAARSRRLLPWTGWMVVGGSMTSASGPSNAASTEGRSLPTSSARLCGRREQLPGEITAGYAPALTVHS
jgi:hypothetical protein